jgi:hypothetical protein
MKIIGNILFHLSAFWLLFVALCNAASLLQPALPKLNWLRLLSRVPLPRPTMTFAWATDWPFLIGLAGVSIGFVLIVLAERRRNWKGRGEI